MAERVTNADIAASLAEIKSDISHLKQFVGEKPTEGLRGDVAMLIGIKNKGWGLIAGLLILAGGAGAAVKAYLSSIMSALK